MDYEEAFEGDDEDELLEGEDALLAADAKRKAKKVQELIAGTQMVLFPLTACPVGTAVIIGAQVNRDCRAVDLAALGTVVATGVVSAGAEVVDLRVHGKTLFNSNGPVPAELFSPLAARLSGNCNFKEIIKSGETISLSAQTLAGGAATAVAGTLLVKAYN